MRCSGGPSSTRPWVDAEAGRRRSLSSGQMWSIATERWNERRGGRLRSIWQAWSAAFDLVPGEHGKEPADHRVCFPLPRPAEQSCKRNGGEARLSCPYRTLSLPLLISSSGTNAAEPHFFQVCFG